MGQGFQAFNELVAISGSLEINSGGGTALQYLQPSQQLTVRYDALWGLNSEVIDHVINFGIDQGYGYRQYGSCTIPAGAGFTGSPAIDLIPLITPVNNQGLVIGAGVAFQASLDVACTVGVVMVDFMGGSF